MGILLYIIDKKAASNISYENILYLINDYINTFDKFVSDISKKEIFSNPDKLYGSFDEKLSINEKLLINAYDKFVDNKNNALN